MGFFRKFWTKLSNKSIEDIESKSFFSLGGFANHLQSYGHTDLADFYTLALYSQTSPLNHAAGILANEFSSLIPQVINPDKQNEIVPNHPVLELLKTPNADSTTAEFLYSICLFYVVTGNSYIIGSGPVNRPPIELVSKWPQQVSVLPNSRDGMAELMIFTSTTGGIDFKREETQSRFRFYNDDVREMWQIKKFNPNQEALTGQSPISPILPEIDQYNAASTHNVSLLKRGGRPSGLLLSNSVKLSNGELSPPMTSEQMDRMKAELNNYIEGEKNAGRVMALAGANLKWENLITSNRDMDFMEGKKDSRNVIYNQYDIPLSFVNPDRMTFNNMGSGKIQLYHNAILPLADRIFNELSIFLMPRYGKSSENLKLTYDKAAIPALKAEKTREVKDKRDLGIYTDNELRAMLGMETYEGGDVIYKPSNLVPVGQDSFTGDEPLVPKTTKKRFAEIMRTKGYSKEKIEEMAVIHGLK